jgi:hypothetical protein
MSGRANSVWRAFHAPLRCIEFAGMPRLLDFAVAVAVADVIASRTAHPVRLVDCSGLVLDMNAPDINAIACGGKKQARPRSPG